VTKRGTLLNSIAYSMSSIPPDVTPTLSADWTDISNVIVGVGAGNVVTLSDINTTISIFYTKTGSTNVTIKYRKNGGSYITLNPSTNISVSNNDTVQWQVETTQTTNQTGTITVKNSSDSDATLGTSFNFTVGVFEDVGGGGGGGIDP
jgi:hypothetical protein